MFARGINILAGSAMDPGNLPVPRPNDALADRCNQAALRALQAEAEFMPPSARAREPERYARIQRARREQLEAFLWVEPNAAAAERMLDLIGMILEEGRWAEGAKPFDDPAHPDIDLQAAETGALLAWTLRRHRALLRDAAPNLVSAMIGEVRRRLISPILLQGDYPFMGGEGRCPGLILSDLLLSCLLMEASPSRRQQPVKALMHLLDRCNLTPPRTDVPLQDRLADACALADLARLLKRLTRGELDLTREAPADARLDDVLIPWIANECFVDPAGAGIQTRVSGMDVFRLGYFSRERMLCALGAQLLRLNDRPCFSVTGRVLAMEYTRAAQDELSAPPRLRRGASDDGRLMVSRMDGVFAALTGTGCRANAGDITLFYNNLPILADVGGEVHSLPEIDGVAPLQRPRADLACDADFGDGRDLMSVDLTDAYPEECGLSACQRTLMMMRGEGSVHLVDAFEFLRPAREVCFRFLCVQRPIPLHDSVRLGPMTLSWDVELAPEVEELPGAAGRFLLNLRLANPPRRLICGFRFEPN